MRAVESDPNVEALMRDAASSESLPLPARERVAEVVGAVALLASCAGIAMLAPEHVGGAQFLTAVALGVLYVVTNRVAFTVGAGFGYPSQLAIVPMLLLLPPALVPLVIVAASALARLPEYVSRRVHPERAVLCVGNAWFAVGPAIVFAVVHPDRHGLELWPVYLAALVAQLTFDTLALIVREWLADGVPPGLTLKSLGLVYAVDVALTPLGVLAGIVAQDQPGAIVTVVPLLGLLAMLGQEREGRIENALALSEAYRGSALLMGEMLEADDEYTGGEHSKGVGALSIAVGEELGLDAAQQRELEFGSLLHDIGKLRTPDEIINKPGKLTPAEWAIIKRHPEDGQEMLDRIGGLLATVGLTVRAHHERWDGNGYPDGLAGEEIPLAARIICATDAFSAMTTDRSYRKAMPVSEAIAELRACSGTQFDPRVVDAIIRVVEREQPQPVSLRLAA